MIIINRAIRFIISDVATKFVFRLKGDIFIIVAPVI